MHELSLHSIVLDVVLGVWHSSEFLSWCGLGISFWQYFCYGVGNDGFGLHLFLTSCTDVVYYRTFGHYLTPAWPQFWSKRSACASALSGH